MLKQWHNFDQKRQISDERKKEREGERARKRVCVWVRERETDREGERQ